MRALCDVETILRNILRRSAAKKRTFTHYLEKKYPIIIRLNYYYYYNFHDFFFFKVKNVYWNQFPPIYGVYFTELMFHVLWERHRA